jgi:hypothetical protein
MTRNEPLAVTEGYLKSQMGTSPGTVGESMKLKKAFNENH